MKTLKYHKPLSEYKILNTRPCVHEMRLLHIINTNVSNGEKLC